jgi:hypothetical protein
MMTDWLIVSLSFRRKTENFNAIVSNIAVSNNTNSHSIFENEETGDNWNWLIDWLSFRNKSSINVDICVGGLWCLESAKNSKAKTLWWSGSMCIMADWSMTNFQFISLITYHCFNNYTTNHEENFFELIWLIWVDIDEENNHVQLEVLLQWWWTAMEII